MAIYGGGMLSFEVIGYDRVLKGVANLADTVKDLRPFWKDVFAPKYFAQVQDGFTLQGQRRSSDGRFAGGRWAPLSPAYAEWKKRHFPGATILVRTGALRDSLDWDGEGLGPGGYFKPEPGYVLFGTEIPYAKHHQDGTDSMPARPFLPDPDVSVFAPLMRDWIMRESRRRDDGSGDDDLGGELE